MYTIELKKKKPVCDIKPISLLHEGHVHYCIQRYFHQCNFRSFTLSNNFAPSWNRLDSGGSKTLEFDQSIFLYSLKFVEKVAVKICLLFFILLLQNQRQSANCLKVILMKSKINQSFFPLAFNIFFRNYCYITCFIKKTHYVSLLT